jgi:hypothetical protein
MRNNDHLIMGVLFASLIAVIALLIFSSVGCLSESDRSGYAQPSSGAALPGTDRPQ